MSTDAKVVAVVGVGPGLGRALAVRFAHGGFSVALVARKDASLRPVQSEIEGVGGAVRSYVCDATNEKSVAATFARINEELGSPEALMYNAGAFKAGGILELSATDFEQAWRVNCLGALLTAQAVVPGMLERGGAAFSIRVRPLHSEEARGSPGSQWASLVCALSLNQWLASWVRRESMWFTS